MNRLSNLVLVFVLLSGTALHAGEADKRYRLDPEKSTLYVVVRKDPGTLASGKAHDHVVLATGWQGSVALSPSWPENDGDGGCRGELTIPVSGLVVDAPQMRERAGLEDTLSEADRTEVRKNMLAADQLNGDKYSTIVVQLVACSPAADGEVAIEARLAIRGATSTVRTTAKLKLERGKLQVDGTFVKGHGDFGFRPYKAFLGAVANQDPLTFHFHMAGILEQ